MLLKDRILAVKAENPTWWPKDIAKVLGCRRQYVSIVLGKAREERESAPQKPTTKVTRQHVGSGRRHVAGYTRLM